MRFNRYKSMFLVTSQMPHPPYTSKTLLPRKFKTLPKKLGHSILCYVSFSVLSRGFWGGDGRFNPTPEGFGGCFEKALSHWQTWMQSLLAPGRPELSHFNHCPSGITYQGCQSILLNQEQLVLLQPVVSHSWKQPPLIPSAPKSAELGFSMSIKIL